MGKAKYGVLLLGFALVFSACSSGEKTEDAADAIPPVTDAATDAVPAANPEVPADPTAAPPPGDDAAALAKLSDAPAPMDAPPAEAPKDMAAATPPEAAPPAVDAGAPAPAAMTADAGSGGSESYTVQQGDTLMKIAFETYGDLYKWKDLYEANKDKISNPNAIPSGTVLKVDKPASPVAIDRNGEKYLIKGGDTLGSISDDVYGTKKKWRKLWENNKQLIKDPNRIFAGFYLYYTISPEERDEVEKLKQTRPQPLAAAPGPDSRMPSSEGQPAPVPITPPEGVPQAAAPIPGGQMGAN